MSESSYAVGYGRPPQHTRFQKGQSGNPGGRPGPTKVLKHEFHAALLDALNADEEDLRGSKPKRVIEAAARQMVLHAVEGRPAAQRLVLWLLDRQCAAAEAGEDEPFDAASAEKRAKKALGERYDEFNRRFRAAVDAGSVDDLAALAEEFQCTEEFPQSGNF